MQYIITIKEVGLIMRKGLLGVLLVLMLAVVINLPVTAGELSDTKTYTVEISLAEEKALLWDMLTIEEWLSNAIHNKARQCTDAIVTLALNDTTGTILTAADKEQIAANLSASGIVLVGSVNQIPREIKDQIVSLAQIASGAERDAEVEAEFP